MTEISFGTLLVDARRKLGLSVNEVAAHLHIRRDIVIAIEKSDLDSMPPSTYSRTMIRRYAEFVGLDPERVVELYANEEYTTRLAETRSLNDRLSQASEPALRAGTHSESDRYRTRPARNYASSRLGDPRNPNRTDSALMVSRSPLSSAYSMKRPAASQGAAPPQFAVTSPSTFRINADDLPESENEGMHATARATARQAGRAAEDAPRASGSDRSSARQRGEGGTSRTARRETVSGTPGVSVESSAGRRSRSRSGSRATAAPNYNATGIYAEPASIRANSRSSLSKFIPIALVIAIVLLIVIVFTAFRGCGSGNSSDQVTTAPVTGLSDTDSSSVTAADVVVAPVAPTSVQFAYSVKSGVETYIEIYLDDSETAAKAETVTGPSKGSYDVTGKLRFVCTSPDGVTITLDGAEVAMTPNSDTSWLYEYEIDFTEYLADWQKEHASEIAAAEKSKAELEAALSSTSESSSAGTSSSNSSSGKTVTTN